MLSQLSYTPVACRHCQFAYPLAFARYFLRPAAFSPAFRISSRISVRLISFEFPFFRTLKIKQHNRHTCNLTLDSEDFFHSSVLHRKEVIQPHLPIRLPCYDFTPVANPTFGSALLAVKLLTSGITGSHGVTGGVYKARERIHRSMLICDY